jgi:hypothetical protein
MYGRVLFVVLSMTAQKKMNKKLKNPGSNKFVLKD